MFGLQGGQAPVRSAALPSLVSCPRAFSVRSSKSIGPGGSRQCGPLAERVHGKPIGGVEAGEVEVGQLGGRCSSTDLAVRQQQSLRLDGLTVTYKS